MQVIAFIDAHNLYMLGKPMGMSRVCGCVDEGVYLQQAGGGFTAASSPVTVVVVETTLFELLCGWPTSLSCMGLEMCPVLLHCAPWMGGRAPL